VKRIFHLNFSARIGSRGAKTFFQNGRMILYAVFSYFYGISALAHDLVGFFWVTDEPTALNDPENFRSKQNYELCKEPKVKEFDPTELTMLHVVSVRHTRVGMEFNFAFSHSEKPYPKRSKTDINLCQTPKLRDTFVRHYPKHEFYYAFNKLVMQLHVVCRVAHSLSFCRPKIQTRCYWRVVRWKLLARIMCAECDFQQQFSRVHVCLMRISVDYCSLHDSLKTETLSFCRRPHFVTPKITPLECSPSVRIASER